ncbi:MAG: hypothetical protein IKO03_06305 [Lachnospiraceae bacterium]|nr:hypothetical protein [Lachnospiraceae bacterium]MBR3508358.1 hypothetical protein [Lachnospiraceae bacterium]MBR4608056.1 hypothetical protein [Lachnospiraceae bacterium]
MNKESMILLIRAFEAIERLEKHIEGLTGSVGLLGSPFDNMFNVARVIVINSVLYHPDDEDGSFDKCMEILRNDEMSAEEKCVLLLRQSNEGVRIS